MAAGSAHVDPCSANKISGGANLMSILHFSNRADFVGMIAWHSLVRITAHYYRITLAIYVNFMPYAYAYHAL